MGVLRGSGRQRKRRLGDERMAVGVFRNSSCCVGVGFQEVGAGVGVIVECTVNVFADAFTVVAVGVGGFAG